MTFIYKGKPPVKNGRFLMTPLKVKLNLCWKILRTNGYSYDYTIRELIDDDF